MEVEHISNTDVTLYETICFDIPSVITSIPL